MPGMMELILQIQIEGKNLSLKMTTWQGIWLWIYADR